MRLEKILDIRDLTVLQMATDTEVGRAIFKVLEHERIRIRKEVENTPEISDDIRKDVRYKLGAINTLNIIFDLPRKAQQLTQKGEKTK